MSKIEITDENRDSLLDLFKEARALAIKRAYKKGLKESADNLFENYYFNRFVEGFIEGYIMSMLGFAFGISDITKDDVKILVKELKNIEHEKRIKEELEKEEKRKKAIFEDNQEFLLKLLDIAKKKAYRCFSKKHPEEDTNSIACKYWVDGFVFNYIKNEVERYFNNDYEFETDYILWLIRGLEELKMLQSTDE